MVLSGPVWPLRNLVRVALCLLLALLAAGTLRAQEGGGFSGLARVDGAASHLRDDGAALELRLSLSQGVPWRVFTLDAPRRLVLDLREADWSGLEGAGFVRSAQVTGLRAGPFRPGWSRLVADLAGPLVVTRAGMQTGGQGAVLTLRLEPASAADFAAASGAPEMAGWAPMPEPAPVAPPRRRQDGSRPLVVALDPGHGGVDPGAEIGGLVEKDLMLTFAREVREALLRAGAGQVVLTREDDSFVPLEERVTIARAAGADLFISLHADSLETGQAHGATVHTLAGQASDRASALLAERHNRADLLAGLDLSGQEDEVALVLMDLARTETAPRSGRLARHLVEQIRAMGAPLNGRPRRSAAFSVLKAPDIPSVLLEAGFLSSERDSRNLRDPAWRARMGEAIARAVMGWAVEDAAEGQLLRQ